MSVGVVVEHGGCGVHCALCIGKSSIGRNQYPCP